ncbi:hypothetical protein [Fowl aviadenovirus A]|nr:hypothetical protein [Fowl aviadenovirus A]
MNSMVLELRKKMSSGPNCVIGRPPHILPPQKGVYLLTNISQLIGPVQQNDRGLWRHNGMHTQNLSHHFTGPFICAVIARPINKRAHIGIHVLNQNNELPAIFTIQYPEPPHLTDNPGAVRKRQKSLIPPYN